MIGKCEEVRSKWIMICLIWSLLMLSPSRKSATVAFCEPRTPLPVSRRGHLRSTTIFRICRSGGFFCVCTDYIAEELDFHTDHVCFCFYSQECRMNLSFFLKATNARVLQSDSPGHFEKGEAEFCPSCCIIRSDFAFILIGFIAIV